MTTSVGSGIGAQAGGAKESVYGTGVTVTHFVEHNKFSANPKKNTAQSAGLAAGKLVQRASRRRVTSRAFGPKLTFDVLPNGLGFWLQQIMGSAAAPVQQGVTTAYLQTHTLADLRGMSATIQSGEPTIDDGVVNPYSYLGSRALIFEFTQEQDKDLVLETTWDARDRTEATALAAASFVASGGPFHWGGFTVKAGAFGSESVVDGITKVSFKIDRKQKTDRFYAGDNSGGYGLHKQPVLNERKEILTAKISADHVTKADLRDRFIADEQFSLIFEWTGANIESTFDEQLTIALPATFLDDDGTAVDGEDVLAGDFPTVSLDDGTHQPCTITYQSTDISL